MNFDLFRTFTSSYENAYRPILHFLFNENCLEKKNKRIISVFKRAYIQDEIRNQDRERENKILLDKNATRI